MHTRTFSPSADVLTRDIRVVDLFAGAGGLSQGFREAADRFVSVGAVELERRAARSWQLNHGDAIYSGSIEDCIAEGNLTDAEVVIGGPPCQGFSALGKRDANDVRNRLWEHYATVVEQVKPRYFVMENVPALLESEQFRTFLSRTEPGGDLAEYRLRFDVLNAAEFGAAQIRRRAIVIGSHRDLEDPGMPVPTHADPATQLTVRQVIGHLPQPLEPAAWRDKMDGRDPSVGYRADELHVSRNYGPLSKARFEAIPKNGNRFDLPTELQCAAWLKHKSGSGDVMGRLRWDKPSVTLRTEFNKPEKGRYIHPTQHRALTAYEGALLQGFPEDYRFVGPMTEIVRQIGNAVPIPLGKAIATHLLGSI